MHVHACAPLAVPSPSLVNYASLSLRADERAASRLALQQQGGKKACEGSLRGVGAIVDTFPINLRVLRVTSLCCLLSRKSMGSITGGRLLNQLFLISSAD